MVLDERTDTQPKTNMPHNSEVVGIKNFSNHNKNTTFEDGNDENNSAKFQLFPLMAAKMIFKYFFMNLTFWLPWQWQTIKQRK